MAQRGMEARNMEEFIDWMVRLVNGYCTFDEILNKLTKKAKEFGAHSPRNVFFSWGGPDVWASPERYLQKFPLAPAKKTKTKQLTRYEPSSEPQKPALLEVSAPCERCGVETTDWMSFDGKTGKCKCNKCFQPEKEKLVEALKAYNQALHELKEGANTKWLQRQMAAKKGKQMPTWVCWATGADGEPIALDVLYDWELDQAV
jgi:hypothetical protein